MTNSTSKYDLLKSEIELMANKTSVWSRQNKKKSFRIYLGIAILSAIVTLFVAIGDSIPFWVEFEEKKQFFVKLLILIFSGLSTVLAAWDGFFNHKQLWINYGETRNRLRALELKLNLMTESEKENKELMEFIMTEYQDIMNSANLKWIKLREEDDDDDE